MCVLTTAVATDGMVFVCWRHTPLCHVTRRSSPLPYTNSDSQLRGVKEIVRRSILPQFKRLPLQLTKVTLLQTLELKLLLKASAEQPPFVLVGHSVGAMYAIITSFRFCMTSSAFRPSHCFGGKPLGS